MPDAVPLKPPGALRLIGLDPGLRRMGYGVIDKIANKITHVGHGVIAAPAELGDLAARLKVLFEGLNQVLQRFAPDEAAVEHTFVNKDAAGTLKLGQARAIALLAPALRHMIIAEYAPNHVKKAIVGVGHADKAQIHHMIGVLLPGLKVASDDAADALALALCHAHHVDGRAREARLAQALARA